MDRVIPADAAFLHRAGLIDVTRVLGAGTGAVRFVGGIVRDTLIGIDAADIDLATIHPPETVVALLAGAGIKSIPTGMAHGTVTAVLPSGPVEVTTLRRDVATDGRHAVVAFTDDWREDAARRDFTMNALYADPITLEIIDYFGGIEDLSARRVRFIGDPLQRIAEDHLRIMRFFRFHARFGDAPDATGLAACAARANDLMALSRERIASELLKLLIATDAVRVVALMIESGIFRPVLPEITTADRLAALALREDESGIAPNAIRRLAALIPGDAAIAEDIAQRLKFSKHDRRRLINAAEQAGNAPAKAIGYRVGTELAVDRLLLSDRPVSEAAALKHWTPPRLPLTGGAFVTRGIDQGPDVARLLRQVEDCWIAEGFPGELRVTQLADAAVERLRSERNA